MAARTAPAKPEPEVATFVVLTDLVNLVVGKKPNGGSQVTRLSLGDRITAPVNHPAILELGAALVREDGLEDNLKAIARLGNAKVRTLQRPDGTTLQHARITPTGVAKRMGAEDDPALAPVEEHLPLDASLPDLTPLGE